MGTKTNSTKQQYLHHSAGIQLNIRVKSDRHNSNIALWFLIFIIGSIWWVSNDFNEEKKTIEANEKWAAAIYLDYKRPAKVFRKKIYFSWFCCMLPRIRRYGSQQITLIKKNKFWLRAMKSKQNAQIMVNIFTNSISGSCFFCLN